MANPILLKHNTTPGVAPTAVALAVRELALNTADGRLFTKTSAGAVVEFARKDQVPAGSGTSTGTNTGDQTTITGNAGTATTLQTARTINGVAFNGSESIETTEWFHSDRDFANGTLVITGIDYSGTSGDPWVLEIRGNSYGQAVPFDLQYQGYIWADTVINHGGYSNGTNISGMVLFNQGGKLCFWWPRQGYWQGYNVRVYTAHATRAGNRVITIINSVKPAGVTKEVALSTNIRQSWHAGNLTNLNQLANGPGYITSAGTAAAVSNQTNSATITAATGSTANTIALRDAAGDISVRELVVTSDIHASDAPTSLMGVYQTTNQVVKYSAARIADFLSGQSMSITGNATTSDSSGRLTSNTGANDGGLQYWNRQGDSVLNPNSNWWYGLRLAHGDADTYYNATLAIDFFEDVFKIRRKQGGVDKPWVALVHSGNIASYAPALTPASASVLGGVKVGSGLTISDGVLATAGGSNAPVLISTNTAAVAGTSYVMTAALTLTLPASPPVGSVILFQNAANAACTVARNGQNIMSLAEDLSLDLSYTSAKLVYTSASQGWLVTDMSATQVTSTTKVTSLPGGEPSYKYGFTTAAVQNPGGNWGKAVMVYDGNGQTYGLRVDRADYADSAGSATAAEQASTLSGDATNWASLRGNAVANMLGWKNYSNNHVIFDASHGTSPTGSAVNNTNSANPWSATYPTLMGWNGNATYGVRVDSARRADSAASADSATTAANLSGFTNSKSTNPIGGADTQTSNGIGYVNGMSLLGQPDGALYSQAYSTEWVHQIYGDYRTGQIAVRGKNANTWQAWRTVLDSANFSSYALPLSGGVLTGNLTVGSGQLDSYIYMGDSDNGTRQIHCNSDRIGFLTQAGSWGAYCDDAGNWAANNLSGVNTGDQTNITGSAGSAAVLTAGAAYSLPQAALPRATPMGLTTLFVGPGGEGGWWENYGTLLNARSYDGGGGTLQLLAPYGPSQGGSGLKMRFGNYDVAEGNAWTAWKTLLASDNFTDYVPSKTGGNASGTWGISITGNAATASNLSSAGGTISSTSSGTGYSSAIQVREVGLGGTQGYSMAYAPRLGFHWGGVVASSLAIEPSGRMAVFNNPGTGYEDFVAKVITATSFVGSAASLTGLTSTQVTNALGYTPSNPGGLTVVMASSSMTATAGTTYVLTASLTLTLPATPSAGAQVTLANRSGTTTCVVARNAQNIMGLAENMTLDIDASTSLVFADATQGWVLL